MRIIQTILGLLKKADDVADDAQAVYDAIMEAQKELKQGPAKEHLGQALVILRKYLP